MENILYSLSLAFIVLEIIILTSTRKHSYILEEGWAKKPEHRLMGIYYYTYFIWAIGGMLFLPESNLFVLLVFVSFFTSIADILLPTKRILIMKVDTVLSTIVLLAILKIPLMIWFF